MKLITRDTDYAVRALSFIASSSKDIVPAAELVRELKVPRPFLRKILQRLNKKKVLRSHKGKGGGFSLIVAPNKIFLLGLIRIFQGPLALNECFLKKLPCPNMKSCVLRRKIKNIEGHMLNELSPITIASLLK
ncbi:MAG: Rrf2 family transcriptional regulator [Candidatus Omnitrophota bacterium]|jgi:Rrf2 family protein